MRILGIFLCVVCALLFTSSLYADGTYCIGMDEDGLYMHTEGHGDWRFEQDAVKGLSVGQRGTYYVGADQIGTYIRTDKHGKFYFNLEEYERKEQEVSKFNKEAEKDVTAVTIDGDQVLVPVTLGYGEQESQALLLLDTGASKTLLHREIADKLGITKTGEIQAMVAGGKKIPTDVVQLSYLSLGPFEKKDMEVGIIDHQGPSVPFQGLLGMDFLRDIEFRVDLEEEIIEWQS